MFCYLKDEQLKMLASKSSSLRLVHTFDLDCHFENIGLQKLCDPTGNWQDCVSFVSLDIWDFWAVLPAGSK